MAFAATPSKHGLPLRRNTLCCIAGVWDRHYNVALVLRCWCAVLPLRWNTRCCVAGVWAVAAAVLVAEAVLPGGGPLTLAKTQPSATQLNIKNKEITP